MWLQAMLSILSILPTMIKSAEDAFSGKPGSGALKKQLVLDTTQAALAIANQINPITEGQSQAIMGTVNTLTDSTVAILNTVDLLNGGAQEQSTPIQ